MTWYDDMHRRIDALERFEAEIKERMPGFRLLERSLVVNDDSVRGTVRFMLAGPCVAVRYSAEKWEDERGWRVLYEHPPKTSHEWAFDKWDFDSREKAMEQVVVALTGVGASRGVLKP